MHVVSNVVSTWIMHALSSESLKHSQADAFRTRKLNLFRNLSPMTTSYGNVKWNLENGWILQGFKSPQGGVGYATGLVCLV